MYITENTWLTSDIATYYYMLGAGMYGLDELEEIQQILVDKDNKQGLKPDDYQQLLEVVVQNIYPSGYVEGLMEIAENIAYIGSYGLSRNISKEHNQFNLLLLSRALNKVVDEMSGKANGYKKGSMDSYRKTAEYKLYRVKNLYNTRIKGEETPKDTWEEFEKMVKKYKELTGKDVYICTGRSEDLTDDKMLTFEDVPQLPTRKTEFIYKWGDLYQDTVFYELGYVVETLKKKNTKRLMFKCRYGLQHYTSLVNELEE